MAAHVRGADGSSADHRIFSITKGLLYTKLENFMQQPLSLCQPYRCKCPFHRLCGPPPPCRAVNVNQSHFANACVLGTFSHTTCFPISCVLSDLLLGQVSNGGGFALRHISFPRPRRGSGQPLPITLRLSACVLGRFSHTTCYPFSCALWACFSDRSVSGELVSR